MAGDCGVGEIRKIIREEATRLGWFLGDENKGLENSERISFRLVSKVKRGYNG